MPLLGPANLCGGNGARERLGIGDRSQMLSSKANVRAWEGVRRQEPRELMGPPLQTRLIGSEERGWGSRASKM